MSFADRDSARPAAACGIAEELRVTDADVTCARRFLRRIVCFPCGTLLFSLAVNLILFSAFLSFASICYESNDDTAMMQIASGVMTGVPMERLVFTNVVIGRALGQLYVMDPSTNWYAYYLLTAHFLASTALLCAFVRLEPSWRAVCAYVLLFAVFEVRLLLEFQFTSAAMLAGFSGALLSLTDLRSGARCSAATVCGGGLMILSAMIRVHSFYFAMLITGPLFLVALWAPLSPRALLLRYVQRLWPCGLSLVLVLGAVEYDRWSYSHDPEWESFREYQTLRATLLDFSVLQDAPNAKFFFERIGWSRNDYNLFHSYYLADEQLSNKETLTSLLVRFGRVGRAPYDSREQRNLYLSDQIPYFAVTCFNVILALALGRGARIRCLLYAVLGAGLFLAVVVYLSIYAKLAARVTLPAIFALNAALMFAWLGLPSFRDDPRVEDPLVKRGMRLRAVFGILFATVYGIMVFHITGLHDELNQGNDSKQRAFDYLVSRIAEDLNAGGRKAVFVTRGSEYPQNWAAPSSSGARVLEKLRTIGLGWIMNSPYFRAQLDSNGISDIYRAIYERPDVYLFGSGFDVDNLVNYAMEHHARKIDSMPPRYYLYDNPADSKPRLLRVQKLHDPASASSRDSSSRQ